MSRKPNISPTLVNLLKEKASHSDCVYKISAICFDNKGNVLGHVTNKHSSWDVVKKENGVGRAGTARHAERLLISKFGRQIKTIVIARVGQSGELRPIDSCPTCKKVAAKYGIKIVSVCPGNKH